MIGGPGARGEENVASAAAARSQSSGEDPAARARAILERRARALARPARPRRTADTLNVVMFELAGETFALETAAVLQIMRLRDLAALPGAVAPIRGITAWRGQLLVVLDLRGVLGLAGTGTDDLRHVIVLGRERSAFGLLASQVRDTGSIAAAAVREPAEGVAVAREYVRGITGEAVIVLDAARLIEHFG